MKTQQNTTTAARRRLFVAIMLGSLTPVAGGLATAHADNEFGSNTPYYEDDAWYDVSEWFDGNDYNPTDEAIGRWDDETYDRSDALTSTDTDNDIDWSESDYGYYSGNDNDWFYDYYDYGYSDYTDSNSDGNFDYTASYYDHDNDGVYDSIAEYADTNSDGVYDTFNYVGFSTNNSANNSDQRGNSGEQQSKRSKVAQRSGSITRVKTVKTPQGENLVVELSGNNDSNGVVVDLGQKDQFDQQPTQGQSMDVRGAAIKAGENVILLATQVSHDGTEREINRSGREYTGTVSDMMTRTVRGNEHQFAKIQTDSGKKLLVDMGIEKHLDLDIQKNSKVTVSGPAVKVNDRLVLIAREVTSEGESTDIRRVALN
ncbi:hypothetical protein [Rhodopirellula sallentina]|uniref:Signal peptide protein n=1 Tax=Rhodopirellula sallentina SM41 TaxID=1263870 RepID=M5UK27_9BACT|nr:hypothetical protein [Rhodopirellula sallentina]EMI56373.1 signal peptide protein [Rhodopirellula sallentina SM41]